MWSLIGPVVLVEAISRNPSRAPQLLPVLAMTLESWVDIAGPKLEAARKRQARRAEAFGESGVQEMIQMIFADIVPDQATSAAA